ncbi:MAG: twin-arginine translocase subunit TatC [Actinomycetota bacterium]
MRADEARPILAHLEELRWRLVKAAAAILVGGIVAFFFADPLREILEIPFHQAEPDAQFQVIQPAEQWGVLMRIAFFGGLILASPVVLYQIWAFVNPALNRRERRWAIPIIAAMVVLFGAGIGFAYSVLSRALGFLLDIFPDVRNDLRLSDYYSFTLRFIFVIGVTFLYPVFLFATAAAGVINSRQLARGRRWAILIVVVVAALVTPTGDPMTLLLFSAPLYLMYEITYWLVRLLLRK